MPPRSASSRERTRTSGSTPWSASSSIEGLAEVPAGNQILVRLDLDLSGILKVTATERATGLAKQVTIDNAMERFRTRQRSDAVDRLEAVFGTLEDEEEAEGSEIEGQILSLPGADSPRKAAAETQEETMAPSLRVAVETARKLIAKAEGLLPGANPEDASELRALLSDLRSAIDRRSEEDIQATSREIEDIVFYLEDA